MLSIFQRLFTKFSRVPQEKCYLNDYSFEIIPLRHITNFDLEVTIIIADTFCLENKTRLIHKQLIIRNIMNMLTTYFCLSSQASMIAFLAF